MSTVVFVVLGVAGCAPDTRSEPAVEETSAALTPEQCSFFDVNSKVQVCHQTSSTTHPYTIVRVSEQACIDSHSEHSGDYVTSTDPSSPLYDPTCQGLGCFPQGAPCDESVPCCDGLTCTAGTCAPACTVTDLELLALPNGWKATGTCGQFKLFVYDPSDTLLDPGVGTGLSIPLVPGSYTFTLRGSGFDLNGGSGGIPPTLSIFSSCGTVQALVEGSSFNLGGLTVTVTSFAAARDNVVDSVSPCAEGADGLADIAGSVTLTVTAP